MAVHQSVAHGAGHDYTTGSPHLRHGEVNRRVVRACRVAVAAAIRRTGDCRVLEVGAGHGVFTEHVLALGARVTVTEMSAASAGLLRERFGHDDRVRVLHDRDGSLDGAPEDVDVVLYLSVLHHIPDYLAAIENAVSRIAPGGAFVSYQDPLWYPRRSRASLLADRAAYLSWRLGQGSLRQGLASWRRRRAGAYDESNPSDMVEYHVVRDGVDEQAIARLLLPSFRTVLLDPYWSTQGRLPQRLGRVIPLVNTFGCVALGRHGNG